MALLFRLFPICLTVALQAQQVSHPALMKMVNEHGDEYRQVSKTIWTYAELGYHEDKISALLQEHLKAAGFSVQAPVADEPTGFVASFGHGQPVIAILGEFDALPGLSQAPVPDRSPVTAGMPGHGCGHNLLGSGAALAAVSVKEYMEKNRVPGTLRYYGRQRKKAGRARSTWFAPGYSKTLMWCCTGIHRTAIPWRTVARWQ